MEDLVFSVAMLVSGLATAWVLWRGAGVLFDDDDE